MNLDHLYDKNGAVEPNKLKTLGEEDKNYIIDLTSFLQNEPTISQRLRCLQLKITEHEKCEFCHVYLRYSPHKHELFKKVCTCDGYKNSPRKRNEIKARIEKFNETIDNRNKNFTPAPILEYESLREILKKHICVETYTQYVIQNVLYKIPGVKESLFYYEPHGRISYKIAKILYGQGYCEKCAAETRFLSIENGFSKYCQRCGGAMAKSQNALINAVDLLIMAGYTIVHRPNSIQNAFTLMCQRGHTFERRFNNGRINSDLTKLCQYCYPRTISSYEFEIKNFLEANGIDAVQQYPIHKYKNGVTRTDLFLPNYNIAIEFNGLMWHSYGKSKTSRFNNHADEKYDKHLCKTIMCENLGIEKNNYEILKKKNILVEGGCDKKYLEEFGNYFGLEIPNIISLNGVSNIEKFLNFYNSYYKNNESIYKPKIKVLFDNDIAGNAACENLAEKIPNDKVVMRLRPVKKDWNECLTAGIICFGFFNNF